MQIVFHLNFLLLSIFFWENESGHYEYSCVCIHSLLLLKTEKTILINEEEDKSQKLDNMTEIVHFMHRVWIRRCWYIVLLLQMRHWPRWRGFINFWHSYVPATNWYKAGGNGVKWRCAKSKRAIDMNTFGDLNQKTMIFFSSNLWSSFKFKRW